MYDILTYGAIVYYSWPTIKYHSVTVLVTAVLSGVGSKSLVP